MTNRQKKFSMREMVTLGAAGLFLAVALLAVIAFTLPLSSAKIPAEGKTNSITETVTVSGMRIHEVSSFVREDTHTGFVKTKQQTMLAFQRSGLVESLLFDEGQRVRKGEELGLLDSRHLAAEQLSLGAKLKQAQAVLAELEKGPRQEAIQAARSAVEDFDSQLAAQRMRLKRSESLRASNSIAQQDYEREKFATQGLVARRDAAKSQLDELEEGTRIEQLEAQRALIASLQADQQRLQYNLDDCTLRAPFDGVIVARFVDPGTVVDAGAAVYELIDDRNLEIHVGVPQGMTHQLQPGANYRVQADQTVLDAKMRVLLPKMDPRTRTYKAILDVTAESDQTLPIAEGQMARVDLTEEVEEKGFWIPRLALTADHAGLWSCYTVDLDAQGMGSVTKQSVEILHLREDWVFVRGTLIDGQVLIREGTERVVPGHQVRVEIVEPRMDLSLQWSTSSVPSSSTN